MPRARPARLTALIAAVALAASAAAAPHRDPLSLKGTVRIVRDRWGVPHIYARTVEQGYFGLGYAHAQDTGAVEDFRIRPA